MSVLSVTAGLSGVLGFCFDFFREGFAISNLRRTDVCLDLELSEQSVDNNLQMQLAHAGNDGLAGFGIGVRFEGRVFFRQLLERFAEFGLSRLGLGFDGEFDNRFRKFHGLEDDRIAFVTDSVTRGRQLEADCRRDIAGEHFLDFVTLVGVHLQDTSDTFLFILCGI